MKWLLVTTNPAPFLPETDHPHGAGWNVGDVFARLGTELLIHEVDPRAEIEFVNMDSASSIKTEREFDRAVFAGRPMFWDGCESHPLWTELLDGWLCRDPRKVMALGVGDCFALTPAFAWPLRLLEHAAARLWRVVVRFPVDADRVLHSVCPSTWLLLSRDEPRKPRKLCNFMDGGGHYPAGAPDEAEFWKLIAPVVARILREHGFEFVAHTFQELDLARQLGWENDRIHIFTLASLYLNTYAQASHYIGNRMHGAAVLAGTSARTIGVGFDSRLGMLQQAGIPGLRPREVTIPALETFCHMEPRPRRCIRTQRIAGERAKMRRILQEFAS